MGDDGLRRMSSLVPAPAPRPCSPERLVCGREGIGDGIAAGRWLCRGGSQSCPLRQRMNVAWPQAWGGVTKPTARGASEPPIPPCDPTRALTASASLTWSSMSLRAGGSPDAAHSRTVMTAGKRRLHPKENSASRGGVSSSRIAQNRNNALPGDDLLETWSLQEAASLQPNHCQGR